MERTTADTSPAKDEVTLRRERGRKAQAAFRQRQITAINELRDHNHAMQSAIASLADVASRLGNAELDDAVRSAWLVADLGGPEEADGSHDCQVTSESLVQQQLTTAMPQGNLSMDGKTWLPPRTSGEPPLLPPTGHYHTAVPSEAKNQRPSQRQDSAANEPQLGYQTGRMSPRLDYGLWLEPQVIRLTNPPIDIMPYLESNTTLSSVVFWSGLVWGFRILQASLEGNSEAGATAHKVFNEVMSLNPGRGTLGGIHARLSFRETGYIASDHPGYDPDGAAKMQGAMARACAANGTSLEAFLRPDEIEDQLRGRLGEGYRVIELGLQGVGSPEELSRVGSLVTMITRSSVCFGDGPRLRFDWMVKLAEHWLKT
ncbi:hypothetical protein BGZ61DRAFT_433687 [Ilyonectria robusta]|uniref:uncharacterized protein n=1 Tax=Ilyonectria robusta TaxID=1079257 RepID=UPI001E8E5F26|nr:uncharacterized protein BGZ61DRAFT_433687 [Ilyonectria robusta]KAH8658985.1 hypothetical protein BGZ61DRAFT_433687 [Ilyonectria robusta]